MKEKIQPDEMDRAARIIRAVGDDSQHGLTLNPESRYFFANDVRGVIPYTLVGKRAMSQGDPACEACDREQLIGEYLDFCKSRGYKPIFNSVSGEMADLLKSRGFRVLRYGEEAVLDLESYTLAGGKKGAMRRNVAKLNRAGITSMEYCPENSRDSSLEKEIADLEEQWFADKKLKLTYSVGDLQFDRPYGTRYFITMDADANLLKVKSFLTN
ncbi:MAG: DUF2156 domain-containing protein, partial [Lachnospiraceae bacterium]|nr:DUF2156 domain-containing protein [Lachnospiraceae bacterium]